MTPLLQRATRTIRRSIPSLRLRKRWVQTVALTALAAGLGLVAVGATVATRAAAVGAQTVTSETSITGITATCTSDGRTCGVLTVQDPIAGETITLHVTGHTPGSSSFHLINDRNILFTGDTLFSESIGRTDLWGGSQPEIITSIQKKLMTFNDDTLVIPGHGKATTIGHERLYNPFLL